jgi:hypothetical protein
VKLLESSWSPKSNWIQAVDKKNNYCSNGIEQMKNCVDQFFWANKFWAVDHDPFLFIAFVVEFEPIFFKWTMSSVFLQIMQLEQ